MYVTKTKPMTINQQIYNEFKLHYPEYDKPFNEAAVVFYKSEIKKAKRRMKGSEVLNKGLF